MCFKVHVSKDSTVADHCRTYALSYPQDNDYATVCNHEHDSKCNRWELLPKLFREVRSVIGSVNSSKEERNEKEYERGMCQVLLTILIVRITSGLW